MLKNYSSLSDSQAEHFVKLNLLNDPNLSIDEDLDQQKAVNIKESVKTLYSVWIYTSLNRFNYNVYS